MMLPALYDWAVNLYPAVQMAGWVAVIAGMLSDKGSTRRIALTIAAAMLVTSVVAASGYWEAHHLAWTTIINVTASIPLFRHPATDRHQLIAATFLAAGAMHLIFAVCDASSELALSVNWLMSIAIDCFQIVLLLWWSWPHVREVVADRLYRGRIRAFPSRNTEAA